MDTNTVDNMKNPVDPIAEQFEETVRQAHKAKWVVDDKYRKREKELMAVVRQTLDQEFGAERSLVHQNLAHAEKEFRDYNDSVSIRKTLADMPYPEGTVLVEWANTQWYHGAGSNLFKKTGRKGVLQVFRAEQKTVCKFGPPRIGTQVVRLMLKDGSLSSRVVELYGNKLDNWFPENVQPSKD